MTKIEKEWLKQVGLRIRQTRRSKGLTLEDAQKKGWPSWRHLQKIESGKNITLLTIYRLCKLFDVYAADLFPYDFVLVDHKKNNNESGFKNLIFRNGKRQIEVAKAIDWHPAAFNRFLNGWHPMPERYQARFCKELGIDIKEFRKISKEIPK